jgi:hypothetical protein
MATKTTSTPKPQPVKTIRLGRIQAALWENKSTSGSFYNVTISRSYKDGDNWKSSDSFGRNDLPILAKVVDQAHTWIFEAQKTDQ